MATLHPIGGSRATGGSGTHQVLLIRRLPMTDPEKALEAERHAALRRLAASLSHALGTPLQVISGNAQLIEEDAEQQPDVLESAQSIQRAAQRMSGLIRTVLECLDTLALPRQASAECTGQQLRSHLVQALEAQGLGASAEVEAASPDQSFQHTAAAERSVLSVAAVAARTARQLSVRVGPGEHVELTLRPALPGASLVQHLEPWLPASAVDEPGSGAGLELRDRVALAVGLGHARDGGAELKLQTAPTQTVFSLTWR